MKPLTLDHLTLLPPWEATDRLEAQLYKEVKPGHPLCGLEVHALARRNDNDDALFAVSGGVALLVVAHLTWAENAECSSAFPTTDFYTSVEDWVDNRMKPDHAEYERGNE